MWIILVAILLACSCSDSRLSFQGVYVLLIVSEFIFCAFSTSSLAPPKGQDGAFVEGAAAGEAKTRAFEGRCQ